MESFKTFDFLPKKRIEGIERFSNKMGFVEINGRKQQIAIGGIKEIDDYLEVEVLVGCEQDALLDTMHKIANESGKTVKASFAPIQGGNEDFVISPEENSKKERLENLNKLFDEAEMVHATEGREKGKEYLPKIYDTLMALNKRDQKTDDWTILWVWNPDGELTEEEFNALNLRRKLLSNAIGILTASGEIRHDLNKI